MSPFGLILGLSWMCIDTKSGWGRKKCRPVLGAKTVAKRQKASIPSIKTFLHDELTMNFGGADETADVLKVGQSLHGETFQTCLTSNFMMSKPQ